MSLSGYLSDSETLCDEPTSISTSDEETLCEEPLFSSVSEIICREPISISKLKLGERGRIWRDKLFNGIALKVKIAKLKARGLTKDEIVDEEPGYYYDEEYHDLLGPQAWYRRNKTTTDLSCAVGSVAGYSPWEYYGGLCHANDDTTLDKICIINNGWDIINYKNEYGVH